MPMPPAFTIVSPGPVFVAETALAGIVGASDSDPETIIAVGISERVCVIEGVPERVPEGVADPVGDIVGVPFPGVSDSPGTVVTPFAVTLIVTEQALDARLVLL